MNLAKFWSDRNISIYKEAFSKSSKVIIFLILLVFLISKVFIIFNEPFEFEYQHLFGLAFSFAILWIVIFYSLFLYLDKLKGKVYQSINAYWECENRKQQWTIALCKTSRLSIIFFIASSFFYIGIYLFNVIDTFNFKHVVGFFFIWLGVSIFFFVDELYVNDERNQREGWSGVFYQLLITRRGFIVLLIFSTIFTIYVTFAILSDLFIVEEVSDKGISISYGNSNTYRYVLNPQQSWIDTELHLKKGEQIKIEVYGKVSPGADQNGGKKFIQYADKKARELQEKYKKYAATLPISNKVEKCINKVDWTALFWKLSSISKQSPTPNFFSSKQTANENCLDNLDTFFKQNKKWLKKEIEFVDDNSIKPAWAYTGPKGYESAHYDLLKKLNLYNEQIEKDTGMTIIGLPHNVLVAAVTKAEPPVGPGIIWSPRHKNSDILSIKEANKNCIKKEIKKNQVQLKLSNDCTPLPKTKFYDSYIKIDSSNQIFEAPNDGNLRLVINDSDCCRYDNGGFFIVNVRKGTVF